MTLDSSSTFPGARHSLPIETVDDIEAAWHPGDPPLKVLNLGAGVQSSTVALMAVHGDIPMFDHAIFADTRDEPLAVYQHLEKLVPKLEDAGMTVHIVALAESRGIQGDMEDVIAGIRPGFSQPPFFILNDEGRGTPVRRQCTGGHKIKPIEDHVKKLAGVGYRQQVKENRVLQHFGISWDEMQRMRVPALSWIEYNYPLIDHTYYHGVVEPRNPERGDPGISRQDCLKWMTDHGYERPPRSACVFCPYKTKREWRMLHDEDPEGWERAIKFDEQARGIGDLLGLTGDLYINSSLVPLAELDVSTIEDAGQMTMFDDLEGVQAAECEGMCGM